MEKPHILLVTFPSQGHINSSLQFAKRLIRIGVKVTFVTAISAFGRMNTTTPPDGLSFAAISDGYDEGFKLAGDMNHFMSEVRRCGSQTLRELIAASISQGTRFTRVVYTIFIPWVAVVAREFDIPQTFLWNQPAAIFNIYYTYFNGYGDVIRNSFSDPSIVVELPGLPPLASHDLPSFFNPSNENVFALPAMKEQLEIIDEEGRNPKILVNTSDFLEHEALKAMEKYNMVGVGPLMPSAFLGGKDPSDTSFGGDLYKGTKGYMEWLNSQPESSVIYVSFGSISVLSKAQTEEIAKGLLGTGFPFLWVIRESGEGEKEEEKLSCKEELEKQGMIVPWCSQVEVLSHPSVGCFITHCGWNSTFESLASGMPVVAFPQWTDQGTNAKLVQDLWKTGVRVKKNEEGMVEGDEIKRCLELVMGGEEMRQNARKWKELIRAAANEGGSSDNNLKTFVDELGK
ncbi:hypothetical protein SLE2022_152700 [Rubroshorea leprosula]